MLKYYFRWNYSDDRRRLCGVSLCFWGNIRACFILANYTCTHTVRPIYYGNFAPVRTYQIMPVKTWFGFAHLGLCCQYHWDRSSSMDGFITRRYYCSHFAHSISFELPILCGTKQASPTARRGAGIFSLSMIGCAGHQGMMLSALPFGVRVVVSLRGGSYICAASLVV
jgi:hypothetical protein